jgi:hypothetical protein
MEGVPVITPRTPSATPDAWTTPERPGTMPVSPTLATHEVAPGGQHIAFPGDADPGGRDIVAASSAQAMANAEARYGELAGDTYGQGSVIGDLLDLPPVISDMSKHAGAPTSSLSGPAG